MTLGENLQKLRKSAGMSQEDVAGRLFVSRQSVSKWENDQAEPGVEHLKVLAALYGVSMDELTGVTSSPGHSFLWTKVGDGVWLALSGLFAGMKSVSARLGTATGIWAAVKALFTSETSAAPEPKAVDDREERAVSFYCAVFWTRTAMVLLEWLLLGGPRFPLDWIAMLVGLFWWKPFVWVGTLVLLWINAGINLLNLLIAPGIGLTGLFLVYLFLCAFFRREVKGYFHVEDEGGGE